MLVRHLLLSKLADIKYMYDLSPAAAPASLSGSYVTWPKGAGRVHF